MTTQASQWIAVSVTIPWTAAIAAGGPSGGVDTSWTFEPVITLALVLYGAVYITRWRRSRAEGGARAAGAGRLALWVAGLLCLALALLTPIDRLGEQFASVHMVQHLLLADLAAIALTLALTRHILRPATRRIQRLERAAGPLAHPAFGAFAYVAVMWIYHVPAVYDLTLSSDVVHTLGHVAFAASGLLYWWHLLSPIRSRVQMSPVAIIAYMAATKVLVGLLGIVLTFSPDLLYDAYAREGRLWGMTALEDQQVAGAVMALEQAIIMGIALVAVFTRMLGEADRADERAERYGAAS